MGKSWFDASAEARAIFDQADRALGNRLGAKLTDLCFTGPAEKLNRTDISQPAIYTASVASWHGLIAKWGFGNGESKLASVAGLSLGEYTALHIAGAFSFLDGLELVTLRGRAMQDAAEAAPGGSGMLALIGADEPQAHAVCDAARGPDVLVAANFNAPGQVVLSGSKVAIDRAATVATEKGLRSAVLPVAGAFHSPLMAPAAQRLAQALAKTDIRDPRCPVVSNVTAQPHGPAGGGVGAGFSPLREVEAFGALADASAAGGASPAPTMLTPSKSEARDFLSPWQAAAAKTQESPLRRPCHASRYAPSSP